jgi:hypothetical protein
MMSRYVELANISDHHAALANQVPISPMAYQQLHTVRLHGQMRRACQYLRLPRSSGQSGTYIPDSLPAGIHRLVTQQLHGLKHHPELSCRLSSNGTLVQRWFTGVCIRSGRIRIFYRSSYNCTPSMLLPLFQSRFLTETDWQHFAVASDMAKTTSELLDEHTSIDDFHPPLLRYEDDLAFVVRWIGGPHVAVHSDVTESLAFLAWKIDRAKLIFRSSWLIAITRR